MDIDLSLAWPWVKTTLYCIVFPIYLILYYIALAIIAILAPVSRVILFVLQPLFFFARLVTHCIAAPFHFLARLETLYVYLGVAALTGLVVGLCLHFFYDFLYATLQLAPDRLAKGPTAKQYRESRRKKAKLDYHREQILSPMSFRDSVSDTPGKGRRGLLAQTIHEEDSDF